MKPSVKTALLFIALTFTFPAHSELEFTQQLIDTNNREYKYMDTYDLDGDGDMDVFSKDRESFRWFENHEGEFIHHEFELESNDFLRLIEVENSTIDFWNTKFHSDSTQSIYVYLENNNYNKTEIISINTNNQYFYTISPGDFNGDQIVDFLTAQVNPVDINGYYEATIKYYYGKGNNQFEIIEAEDKFFVPASNDFIYYFKVLDVNNDSKDDLVYLNYFEQELGALVFQKSTSNNSYEIFEVIDEIAPSDVSNFQFISMGNDGILDAIDLGSTSIWYEQINDSFVRNTFEINNYHPDNEMFFEDYDNDNDYDIISFPKSNQNGFAYYYENIGGDFPTQVEIDYIRSGGFHYLSKPGDNLKSFVSLDYIYDVSKRINLYQYENDHFQVKQISNDFINTAGIEAVDLTGNNLLDLVAFDRYSTDLVVYYQSLGYKFSHHVLLKLNKFTHDIMFIDDDSDGDLDLLFVNSDSENSFFETYYNDGHNNFTLNESVLLPIHLFRSSVKAELIDINRDGNIDITYSEKIGIELGWLHNQSSEFVYQQMVNVSPVNEATLAYDFGDLDGDGNLDVVYSYIYLCQFICYGETIYAIYDEQTNKFADFTPTSVDREYFDLVFIENLNDDNLGEIVFTNLSSNNNGTRKIYTLQSGELVEITDPLDPSIVVQSTNEINNDGIVDFLYWSGNNYQFMTSNQDYNWSVEDSSGLEYQAFRPFIYKDFDGNGEIDFVTQNSRSMVVTFQGELIQIADPVPIDVNHKWAILMLIFGMLLIITINHKQFPF